jgi:hypothetical protein
MIRSPPAYSRKKEGRLREGELKEGGEFILLRDPFHRNLFIEGKGEKLRG